jgi:hypothetical protein
MSKRDRIAEIAEVKARGLAAGHPYKVAITHLRNLEDAIAEMDRKDLSRRAEWEVYRGLPVLVTATLESYFRATIARLVDSGDPFRGRARDLRELKLDITMLLAMEGERVTLGELVAHSLSLNGPEELGTAFKMVSGEDLWPKLGPNREAATGQPHLFPRTDEEARAYYFGGLRELYRIRHIVCHEQRSNAEVSAADAAAFCDIALEFLLILEYLVDEMLRSRESREPN